MRSKLLLPIVAIVLAALCAYFLSSTAPSPVAETPSRAKTQAPQTASSISGSSQIHEPDAPAATKVVQYVPMALIVAKMTLPLAFADSGPNPELRQAVARDLQMIYGHLDGHEVVSSGVVSPVVVKGRAITPIKLINFTGAGRYFPKVIDGEIGYVGIVDGHDALLITDKVITAYSEAVKRRSAEPAAYNEIEHFIDDLNLLTTKPISDTHQMFVVDPAMANASGQLEQMSPQMFTQRFGGQRYRAPSLLEIVDGAQISDRYKGRLVAKLYAQTKDGLKDHMPPIIFDQGRWKFLILPPPT